MNDFQIEEGHMGMRQDEIVLAQSEEIEHLARENERLRDEIRKLREKLEGVESLMGRFVKDKRVAQ
jgi:hypothetical protein